MSRAEPCFEPCVNIITSRSEEIFSLEICVVTPMFGGSAVPREVDPEMPVTAKSVRGHLRFWWRACCAPRYKTAQELFEAESAIWGRAATYDARGKPTGGPSGVDIIIDTLEAGKAKPCADYRKRPDGTYRSLPDFAHGYPPYALFPFKGEQPVKAEAAKREKPAEALEGIRFRLRVLRSRGDKLNSQIRDDIEAALWAWLCFGGVGARTRRGCGSLWAGEGKLQGSVQSLNELAARYVATGDCKFGVPVLSGARILCNARTEGPGSAWQHAVEVYRNFRQAEGFARNEGTPDERGQKRPRRSRWPEADSIRDMAGTYDLKHRPAHKALRYFPRADLGLPIVFHYQSNRDPGDRTLQATGQCATRMASPVIIKPLPTSADMAAPMLLILQAPHVWNPIAGGIALIPGSTIQPAELRNAAKSSQVGPLNNSGNAIEAREALLNYVKNQWKAQEVTL